MLTELNRIENQQKTAKDPPHDKLSSGSLETT